MQPPAYCFHQTFEPAGPSAFRMDRHYLLHAMEGTLRLEAQGRRWSMPPARAALIRAGHPVTITILSRLTSASVLFAPGFIPDPPEVLSVFEMSPLARELVRECRNWGAEAPSLSPYAERIFLTLGEVALRLAAEPSRCSLPTPSSPELRRAVQLMEAHIGDPAGERLSFAQLARASHLSSRSLSRRFSSEMGMTWREAMGRIRVIKAVEALAVTEAPVSEIAYSVGYGSLSGFNAAFRSLMDLSPTQFRESLGIGTERPSGR